MATMTNNSGIITLNVGGSTYTTSLTTLTKCADSHLAQQMFAHVGSSSTLPVPDTDAAMSGPASHQVHQDAQGNFVIDRDGQLFRYILNFLRTGLLNLPDGFLHTDALMAEAEFYNITEFKRALEAKTIVKVEERVYEQSGRKFEGSYRDWTILGDPASLLWLAEVGVFSQDGQTGPTITEGGSKLHRAWYNDIRIAVSHTGYQYGFCNPETPILKECIFNEIVSLGYKLKLKLNHVSSTLEINDHVKAFVHLNREKSHTYVFQLHSGSAIAHQHLRCVQSS